MCQETDQTAQNMVEVSGKNLEDKPVPFPLINTWHSISHFLLCFPHDIITNAL